MARKTLNDSTIQIHDGTGTPLEVELKIGTGNITWSESYPREYTPERGSVADGTVRDLPEEPCEMSVTATWEFVKGDDSVVTPYDALTRTGEASAWVSTGADGCEPYAVDVLIFFALPCTTTGSPVQELITFPEYRVESCNFDVDAGTIQFTGKSKAVRPTTSRTNTAI